MYTLDDASGSYLRERMTTDPTISSQLQNIFHHFRTHFRSMRLWRPEPRVGSELRHGRGAFTILMQWISVTDLSGTLYLQTSTGAIYQDQRLHHSPIRAPATEQPLWFLGMPPENVPHSYRCSRLRRRKTGAIDTVD